MKCRFISWVRKSDEGLLVGNSGILYAFLSLRIVKFRAASVSEKIASSVEVAKIDVTVEYYTLISSELKAEANRRQGHRQCPHIVRDVAGVHFFSFAHC
jgi:hypothetical protein